MDINVAEFILIKGFIDAKTAKDTPIFGSFLALASRRDIDFVSTSFSPNELSKDSFWKTVLAEHKKNKSSGDRDAFFIKCEDLLKDFFYKNGVLNTVAKNHATKPAEQAISRFCMDTLSIRSVTFLDFQDASEQDIQFLKSNKESASGSAQANDAGSGDDGGAQSADPSSQSALEGKEEIFVKCEPILDPLRGVAANEVQIGDILCAKLPSDSIFYKLLARSHNMFDGVVTSEVTGILVNELGFATISLKLSDNVIGVLKSPGKVKLRAAAVTDAQRSSQQRRPTRLGLLSPEAVVGFSVILLLCAILLAVYYILLDG